MKKALALTLALLAALALFTGCEPKNLDGEKTTGADVSMPSLPKLDLSPSKVDEALSAVGLGDKELSDLSAEEQARLESRLHESGYDVTFVDGKLEVKPPANLEIPSQEAPATTAKPMPSGQVVESDEGKKLLQGTQNILKSKTFTLKGTGIAAMPFAGASSGTPTNATMIMAVDQNKIAMESSGSLGQMMTASAEEDYYGQNKIRAAAVDAMFGKRFRMVIAGEKIYYVFPDRKIYVDFGAMAASAGEAALDTSALTGIVDEMFGGESMTATVTTSKVKVDGKEYTCASVKDADGSVRSFYYLGGELKRMEQLDSSGRQISLLQVDSLTGTVDQSLFSVKGMTAMDLVKFASIFGA
ncbi:MAG: hypothetical protein LBC83_03180 [Oscillospiraceae bacterium]|nr:hypothetical protein [Oscillospiraceae bacterium]